MNYKKLATLISLVICFFCQTSTAWAYLDSPSDAVLGYVGTAIFMVVIFGLVIIVLRIKVNRLRTRSARLKNRDPGFDEQVFLDKVAMVFLKVMHAWANRDMEPVRAFMSDEAFSYFNVLLEKHIRNGTFNRLDELSLDKVEYMGIQADAFNDTIDIWITAKARDYVVDEYGKRVSGSTNKFKTRDIKWTLTRSVNAITIADKVTVSPDNLEFDWILVRISKISIPDSGGC